MLFIISISNKNFTIMYKSKKNIKIPACSDSDCEENHEFNYEMYGTIHAIGSNVVKLNKMKSKIACSKNKLEKETIAK